jgi:hypothetical protein
LLRIKANGPWGIVACSRRSHAIQYLFIERRQPYPVERTLLVTGVLDAAMQSHAQGGKAIETPHLEIAYRPIDFRALRENGTSWKIITQRTPQPTTFSPGDKNFVTPGS